MPRTNTNSFSEPNQSDLTPNHLCPLVSALSRYPTVQDFREAVAQSIDSAYRRYAHACEDIYRARRVTPALKLDHEDARCALLETINQAVVLDASPHPDASGQYAFNIYALNQTLSRLLRPYFNKADLYLCSRDHLQEIIDSWLTKMLDEVRDIAWDADTGEVIPDNEKLTHLRVRRALEAGRPVPPSVMIRFPDLLEEYGL